MTHAETHATLLQEYRRLFESPPPWAFPLPPSIPFVGRDYFTSKPRIAVFASAENLTCYERGTPVPAHLTGDLAWNRHRLEFEAAAPTFFPSLHIAPVENGHLLCAVLFLRQELLQLPSPPEPRLLLETLVAANVGKFSIRTGGARNRDYAGNEDLTGPSLPFFAADLRHLAPDIILLPKTIHRHAAVARIVKAECPSSRVLALPQFNATVVNTHLASNESRGRDLEARMSQTPVGTWTERLRGLRRGYAYRYYAEIELAFSAKSGSVPQGPKACGPR